MNMRLRSVSIFVFAMVIIAQPAVSQIREATVTGGIVKGQMSNGVSSFKGIPFAAPPVGDLRWKPPQPVEPWKGKKKAKSFAPVCMQNPGPFGGSAKVSEDCLYLNVWTAAENTDEKRPVMVWIYGGGFSQGRTDLSLYDGENFARNGVVFVSIAYRVGLFGFLAHPDLSRESGKGSGNYGLLDMVAALQWVKENIAEFGGDPSCVTIFGQSAGGAAVSMLAASPYAKGLFHRVISQSGGSFSPPRVTGNEMGQNVPALSLAESRGKAFLEDLKVEDIDTARKLKAKKLLESMSARANGFFWPVADGDVLPGDQYELYLNGRFNDTPILIGTNSDEGAAFFRGRMDAEMFERYIRARYGPEADAILSVYPHSDEAEATQSAKDIGRDSVFAWDTWSWARLQSRIGKNNAYVYYFAHYNPAKQRGAGHGAEVSYVFGNLMIGGGGPMMAPGFGRAKSFSPRYGSGNARSFSPSEEDKILAGIMHSYWINFARTGDPNGSGLPLWPAFNEEKQNAMIFDPTHIIVKLLPNMEKLEALDLYFTRRRMEAKGRSGNSN